ncbi:MAG TPA: family 16 glycoside hydrolase, partial [Tepidisphaeraceae bacterium]|nr:family 16 glycoside hydrolase [Tepidisphaeraceae bacterium]
MKFLHWLLLGCLFSLFLKFSLPVLAADKALFTDSFATGDLRGWTLQSPINGLGPISANGTWKTEGKALVATGTAAPWTIQTGGDANWTDYKLSVKVTIKKPAPKSTFPIISGEFDRYLPREDYPGAWQHTGQYRFRYYAGEFDWGSDAAVYLRYQDRNDCYRVQLSTEYQEMILWHGIGGYLQVVPCKIEPGKTYALDVQAQGNHLIVSLDGKKTIDYWHTCLPTLHGGIGLAAYNSTVAFQDVKVTALPAPATGAPAHQTRFTIRQWRTLQWIFDGNEPILQMEIEPGDDDYQGQTLMWNFIKLRPGYRPSYYVNVNVRNNNVKTTRPINGLKGLKFGGDGTDRMTIDFDSATSDKGMLSHHTDALTFDRVRGVYRHDFNVDVTFAVDQQVYNLEFADPLTYNNKEPGKGVKYPWLPAGHNWGVFIGEDGKYTRHPITESIALDNWNSWYMRSGSFWMLYPDRAVCPVWEHNTPGERTYNGICHWGYDYHQNFTWTDKQRKFKAGDHFHITYAMTGYPPEEGEKYFLQSKLAAKNENIEQPGKVINLMRVPSAYAFPVCDPAGTTFDQLVSSREPYVGWQFVGDYTIDNEIGRTDHHSLRLDGPASTDGQFYHHMLDSNAKRYLCTVWLKTKGVKGDVKVVLRYSFNPKGPADVIPTG